jgi:hypothetical protein
MPLRLLPLRLPIAACPASRSPPLLVGVRPNAQCRDYASALSVRQGMT